MKYLITILIIITSSSVNAQNIKLGDNLQTEYRKISKPYFFPNHRVMDWVEGDSLLYIGMHPNPKECGFLFIALKDTTLIGVLTMPEPNVFIFDENGDSILDNTFDFFMLPSWIVKNKTRIDPKDSTIISVLNDFYEQSLQADDGHTDKSVVNRYLQYKTDTSLANRHIALLFDNYQTLIDETAAKGEDAPTDLCLFLMNSLADEFLKLYNILPAIVVIYMGETLLTGGMLDKARSHFKMGLQFYPNSIPMLVYSYRLEQDPVKKKQMLESLKMNHPNHWMVKDL